MCACLAHVARGTGDRSACLAAAFWTCRGKWQAAVAVGSDVVICVPDRAEHVLMIRAGQRLLLHPFQSVQETLVSLLICGRQEQRVLW